MESITTTSEFCAFLSRIISGQSNVSNLSLLRSGVILCKMFSTLVPTIILSKWHSYTGQLMVLQDNNINTFANGCISLGLNPDNVISVKMFSNNDYGRILSCLMSFLSHVVSIAAIPSPDIVLIEKLVQSYRKGAGSGVSGSGTVSSPLSPRLSNPVAPSRLGGRTRAMTTTRKEVTLEELEQLQKEIEGGRQMGYQSTNATTSMHSLDLQMPSVSSSEFVKQPQPMMMGESSDSFVPSIPPAFNIASAAASTSSKSLNSSMLDSGNDSQTPSSLTDPLSRMGGNAAPSAPSLPSAPSIPSAPGGGGGGGGGGRMRSMSMVPGVSSSSQSSMSSSMNITSSGIGLDSSVTQSINPTSSSTPHSSSTRKTSSELNITPPKGSTLNANTVNAAITQKLESFNEEEEFNTRSRGSSMSAQSSMAANSSSGGGGGGGGVSGSVSVGGGSSSRPSVARSSARLNEMSVSTPARQSSTGQVSASSPSQASQHQLQQLQQQRQAVSQAINQQISKFNLMNHLCELEEQYKMSRSGGDSLAQSLSSHSLNQPASYSHSSSALSAPSSHSRTRAVPASTTSVGGPLSITAPSSSSSSIPSSTQQQQQQQQMFSHSLVEPSVSSTPSSSTPPAPMLPPTPAVGSSAGALPAARKRAMSTSVSGGRVSSDVSQQQMNIPRPRVAGNVSGASAGYVPKSPMRQF